MDKTLINKLNEKTFSKWESFFNIYGNRIIFFLVLWLNDKNQKEKKNFL